MISRVGARRPVGARALPEHAVAREEAPAVQIRVRLGQLAQAVRRRTLGRESAKRRRIKQVAGRNVQIPSKEGA